METNPLILDIQRCRRSAIKDTASAVSLGPGVLGILKKETLSRVPRLW